MSTQTQPTEITLHGTRYVLSVPFSSWIGDNGETRSEGPFYESVPPSEKYKYMPDIAFLKGITTDPLCMHVIWKQERAV